CKFFVKSEAALTRKYVRSCHPAPGSYRLATMMDSPPKMRGSHIRAFIVFVSLARAAFAQITTVCSASGPCVASAYNAAGYIPKDLPGGGIAQGSMMAIAGLRLGPSNLTIAPGFPLATFLADTSVEVASGSFRQNAPIYYTSDRQVAAILPSST